MDFELAQMFGYGRGLYIEPKAFRAWLAQAKPKAAALAGPNAVQDAIALHAQRDVRPMIMGDVAVIDVCGPIVYKSTWLSMFFGCAAIEDMQTQFRIAMADSTVKSIVFRCDTPGGVVDFMPEFADEVYQARGKGKQILAVADLMVCSCGYWLASQADAIYATTSSQIGAIGVFCEHASIAGMLEKAGIKITLIAHGENKVAGNPYEDLSPAAHEELQQQVDEVGGWFDNAVARGRKVSVDTVLRSFGQGKVFRGAQAIKLGLADKVGTFGQVVSGLAAPKRGGGIRGSVQSATRTLRAEAALQMVAGVVPKDISDKLAPRDTPWSALTLSDFTDKGWDELSDTEQRNIAGHFAWAKEMPPATFGDLKLGHHRASDGAVVFRGVTAALGRLDQSDIPDADKGKVRAHLEAHQAQFEKQDTSAAATVRPVRALEDGNGDEPVQPNEDGSCPDGYVKDDDGLCYLADPDDPEEADEDTNDEMQAQADAEAITAVLSAKR